VRGLPPITPVAGAPINVAVVYPPRDATIASRDSNFVIGSVGSGDVSLSINGVDVEVKPNGAYLAWLEIPPGSSPSYRLIATRGSDTVVLDHPVRTFRSPVPPARPRPPSPPPKTTGYVMLGARASADSGRVVSVRPVPGGTYKWFAIPGTVVERTGAESGFTRIRLDANLEAFVLSGDVVEFPDDEQPSSAPSRVIPNLTVVPDSAWTDVVFPVRNAPMYLVEEEADKLILTLYSTRATTDIIGYRSGDSVVRAITWEPLSNDRVRYVIHLRRAPFGYVVSHDGRALTLRIRKAPMVRMSRPLEGLTIAVDAGHPPAGANGPTGLYEGDATLPISMALKEELESRGARVLMTRTTLGPVELGARPLMARAANAHAFVSIHLNALPDGINPLMSNGTGTYFFHPQSEPLARAVQKGMVRSMGLRDLGVYYDNLAVVRETWMPAVLCEGAFVIVPEQEAAMRQPEGQRAYARGVAEGLEAYFRALGETR
jgi:N-acetylmuramoyl-L-alanine amidase